MDSFIRNYTHSEVETRIVDNVTAYNSEYLNQKDYIRLFHTNIRSVAKNFDELRVFLCQFFQPFQIIILTETFKVWDLQPYNIPGYDLIYNSGDVNKNDGVILYINSDLNYDYSIVKLGEMKVIKVVFQLSGKRVCVSAMYRLHPLCPFAFNCQLSEYLKTIKNDIDISVIVGDININILGEKDFAQEYLNVMSEEGYISQINQHTRIDGNKKSCIDHVFVRHTDHQITFTPIILRQKITDHYPILFHMNCIKRKLIRIKREKYFINYTLLIKKKKKYRNRIGRRAFTMLIWMTPYSLLLIN